MWLREFRWAILRFRCGEERQVWKDYCQRWTVRPVGPAGEEYYEAVAPSGDIRRFYWNGLLAGRKRGLTRGDRAVVRHLYYREEDPRLTGRIKGIYAPGTGWFLELYCRSMEAALTSKSFL